MTAYEWCELLAIGALLVGGVTWLNWGPDADDDQAEFQRTAADAARDAAAIRRTREIAQLYAIWPDPPRGKAQLPHRTRRTEEDR